MSLIPQGESHLSKDVKLEFQQNHLSEVLMSVKRSLARKVVTEQHFY